MANNKIEIGTMSGEASFQTGTLGPIPDRQGGTIPDCCTTMADHNKGGMTLEIPSKRPPTTDAESSG